MIENELHIVTFLSGKGGSGKTTVAISMAKLLADIGQLCLLIDFDLSTNGASYFFQPHFSNTQTGIWELLQQTSKELPLSLKPDLMPLDDGLLFMPSRGNLRSKGIAYEDLSARSDENLKDILNSLIDRASKEGCKYVFIDCQAGYSISSGVAASISDLAVIVTEADAISSDAADNLLIQLGEKMPSERRHLVNKIDVRDADTYRKLKDVFSTMNRLPPLPFDFNVRNAFGARNIPVNIKEPSPLLFALFETMRAMLPELHKDFEKYRTDHIEGLFEVYSQRFEKLITKREALQEKKTKLEIELKKTKSAFRNQILYAVTASSLMSVIAGTYSFLFGRAEYFTILVLMSILVTMTFSAMTVLIRQKKDTETLNKNEGEISIISLQSKEIDAQLDNFRSLLWSQSKEYLIDEQIAGRLSDRYDKEKI